MIVSTAWARTSGNGLFCARRASALSSFSPDAAVSRTPLSLSFSAIRRSTASVSARVSGVLRLASRSTAALRTSGSRSFSAIFARVARSSIHGNAIRRASGSGAFRARSAIAAASLSGADAWARNFAAAALTSGWGSLLAISLLNAEGNAADSVMSATQKRLFAQSGSLRAISATRVLIASLSKEYSGIALISS